mgnify:CR=1 FL=1
MTVSTPAFGHNTMIPQMYSCKGEGIRPALTISDIPENTQSLAIIMDDPDALNGTFIHWTVWNIPATIQEISGSVLPEGSVEGENSSGQTAYFPPCPPSGIHRYRFHVFALKGKLSLPPGASREELEKSITPLILAKAELIGLYSPKQEK